MGSATSAYHPLDQALGVSFPSASLHMWKGSEAEAERVRGLSVLLWDGSSPWYGLVWGSDQVGPSGV